MTSSVRKCTGQHWWISQRDAKREVAFSAVTNLYHAGLLNDYLLPSSKLYEDLHFHIGKIPSKVEVSATWTPWIAQALATLEGDHGSDSYVGISIARPGRSPIRMFLLTAKNVAWTIPPCHLYWSAQVFWIATFDKPQVMPELIDEGLSREATEVILASVHRHRMDTARKDLLPLIVPCLEAEALWNWLVVNSGRIPAGQTTCPAYAVVRHGSSDFMPHLVQHWGDDGLLEVTSFPRRRNFLVQSESRAIRQSQVLRRKRKTEDPAAPKGPKTRFVPMDEASVDKLAEEAVTFAQLLPSLLRHIQSSMVAMQACDTILSPVGFFDNSLVKQAISASAANESVNYQRLEFLGDSILKFITAVQLFVRHPMWHEGYLSRVKDSIVANATLANAAMTKHLDQYIITSQLSPRKWRPQYLGELLESGTAPSRRLSSKILADVVEALIGAAFLDASFIGAVTCAHVFLDQIDVEEPSQTIERFLGQMNKNDQIHSISGHAVLEDLIGYHFSRPFLLIEAMTHVSCSDDFAPGSYQRLEFLGDAILEVLVVDRVRKRLPETSHVDLHLMKDALTNAELLAYFCMGLSTTQSIQDVIGAQQAHEPKLQMVTKRTALCQYLRLESFDAALALKNCLQRYDECQERINRAILTGRAYPRSLLLQLGAPKFLSDIVESVLGAIYVDSGGDLTVCEAFATTLGLLPYLDRILTDSVDVLHPKSRLSEMAESKIRYHISRDEVYQVGYRCYVEIDGRKYPEVGEGVSKDEVTTRAAEAAFEALSKERTQSEAAA